MSASISFGARGVPLGRRQLAEHGAGENVVLPYVHARLFGEDHPRLERPRPIEYVMRLQTERVADAVKER